jgi:hypothetical protein
VVIQINEFSAGEALFGVHEPLEPALRLVVQTRTYTSATYGTRNTVQYYVLQQKVNGKWLSLPLANFDDLPSEEREEINESLRTQSSRR